MSGLLGSSSSPTSASPSSSAPSVASLTQSLPQPIATPADTNQDTSQSLSSASHVTVTSVFGSTPSVNAANAQTSSSSSISHTAVMVLIVLASSVGGIAIIWTIIRKWKFRPSSQFEDRMQPIDWQPTDSDHDSGLPPLRRGTSSASSFHSAGHEPAGNYGATLDPGHRVLTPLPDHDFTPGPTTLAPGGGYADLARGSSPQPQMHEALARGPSMNRGFDQYGLPLHHQGAYGAPNAYGGY